MNNCSKFMSDMSTKNVLFVASVWILINILLYTWSEWQAWHGFVYTSFVRGLVFIAMCVFCAVASAYLLIKKKIIQAAMYILIVVATIFVSRNQLPIEMMVKAYFFSVYPQLCPVGHDNDQTSFICYVYNENMIGGANEQLVIDPSDAMQLPPSEWPQYIKTILGFADIHRNISDNECQFRNTRYMVNHVFWISNNCLRSN